MPFSEDEMEKRVRRLEVWREGAERRLVDITNSLRANTEMTAAVKADTAQIVEFFTASRVGARLVKWFAALATAAAAVYASWRHY